MTGETPNTATMRAETHKQPGLFTLRELFVLTALCCALCASWSWAWRGNEFGVFTEFGILNEWGVLATVITFSAAAAYLVHVLTRRSLAGVVGALVPLVAAICLMLSASAVPRRPARRMQCAHHLKIIGLALQN